MTDVAPFRVGDRVMYRDGSRATVTRVRWAPAWWMVDIDWDDNYWDHLAWRADRFKLEGAVSA